MALSNLIKIGHYVFPYQCCSAFYSNQFYEILKYKKCYQVLGISADSDQEQIRQAYLMLVKKYHPDSNEGNSEKFQEIDQAFRTLIDKKSKERWEAKEEEVQEQDIKHTAPQHRQYLSYGGIGFGTPYQREKQYTKSRAMQAAENVLQHRIQKIAVEENTLMQKVPLKHKIKTKYGFDRLVEDLIQEAMSKGQFNNLSGCGKPLNSHQNRNPYVDFVTHKINEVLIENGFTPEWITLQKEIRQEVMEIKDDLSKERENFGPHPLTQEDYYQWCDRVQKYKISVCNVNKKINKFNLVVPVMNKQMLMVDLEREAQKILVNGKYTSKDNVKKTDKETENMEHVLEDPQQFKHLFGFLDSLLK